MNQVIKIALPGYNALTDIDPDHFSLFVDPSSNVDYVLIKEKTHQTVSVSANSHTNISHNLGYVPFCLVFAEVSSDTWRKLFSTPIDGTGFSFTISSSELILYNNTGNAKNFSYIIFYDEVA